MLPQVEDSGFYHYARSLGQEVTWYRPLDDGNGADTLPMPPCVTGGYSAHVSHNYRFKRGDPVRIRWGRYAGAAGVVDSAVFQRTVDYPDEQAAGYHVVLDDERVVTVRWDQVSFSPNVP